MLIALRFNLSVDYNIELPQNKTKTSTAASSKAEASSSFKGFGFFKTLNTTWFNRKFQHYTPLNTNRTRILQEAMATKIIQPPRKARTPERAYHNKHYEYHKSHGHHTEECIGLKDIIEELIQAGQLRRFVRSGNT